MAFIFLSVSSILSSLRFNSLRSTFCFLFLGRWRYRCGWIISAIVVVGCVGVFAVNLGHAGPLGFTGTPSNVHTPSLKFMQSLCTGIMVQRISSYNTDLYLSINLKAKLYPYKNNLSGGLGGRVRDRHLEGRVEPLVSLTGGEA